MMSCCAAKSSSFSFKKPFSQHLTRENFAEIDHIALPKSQRSTSGDEVGKHAKKNTAIVAVCLSRNILHDFLCPFPSGSFTI
jgi:hypothetical protein